MELEAASVEVLDDAGRALQIKLEGARNTGKLDLTDFRLEALPEEIWDIEGLEVRGLPHGMSCENVVLHSCFLCLGAAPRVGIDLSVAAGRDIS